MGGDCTWTGCVPSKTLLSIAKTAHSARTASHGISVGEVKVDMKAVKARIDSAAAGSKPPSVGTAPKLWAQRLLRARLEALGAPQALGAEARRLHTPTAVTAQASSTRFTRLMTARRRCGRWASRC